MSDKLNFLCEIGTEEIPAGYIPPLIEELEKIFRQKLEESRIGFKKLEVFATPRRLVILANKMAEAQSLDKIEVKGPSVKAAYDEKGEPTKALSGFLSGNKISCKDIFTKNTDKGDYVFAIKKMDSLDTEKIIPGIIENIIKNIGTPKKMRWSDKNILFPRPILYLLIMLNDKVVPFEISGISSGKITRGHYIQHNKMIEINKISSYESILAKNGVILNQHKRKEKILKELKEAAEKINGRLVEDAELLSTVTFLTENPYVVVCHFAEKFLEIPEIVLITEMKEHQKYFAVRDGNGSLMPNFLVVSNNPPTGNIKKGNERVITARMTDAAFFFKEDRKTKLVDKVDSLKSVLFHKELGTVYDKIERMSAIADQIIKILNIDESAAKKIKRAILLSKADLVTAMVIEFSSLQGKMGRIYALLDGEDEEVANAIDNYYKPRFQDDDLPLDIVGIVVSVAEKIDNIFGAYSAGNIPKGSVDPYALRRQANAIVEIFIKNKINISLNDVSYSVSSLYKDGKTHVAKIFDFISARAKTIFQENGFRYDEIDACLSIGNYDYFELFKRALAVNEFRKNPNFSEMLLSFKRMNNILSIFLEKNPGYKLQFTSGKLAEDAEKDLYDFFNSRKNKISGFIKMNDYTGLFKLLIEGKLIIDNFFDKVMVMTDDLKLRDNRLALLGDILNPFINLLDFSKITE